MAKKTTGVSTGVSALQRPGGPTVLTPKSDDSLAKVPVFIDLAATMDVEYQRIASKIGTSYAEPIKQFRLESYLRDNHIDVYPLSKVTAFMNKKAASIPEVRSRDWRRRETVTKMVWTWFPLRPADVDGRPGRVKLDVYDKPVPVAALMTVEKIVDDLGAGVHFYVADLKKETKTHQHTTPAPTNVDPFLCVTAAGCPLYVIERWDEPAFRS